jgi:hypothetical protein
MRFEYRGFAIDCSATEAPAGFVGSVKISRLPAGEVEQEANPPPAIKFFPTRLQAIEYVRVCGEIWCDGILTPEGADDHPSWLKTSTKNSYHGRCRTSDFVRSRSAR